MVLSVAVEDETSDASLERSGSVPEPSAIEGVLQAIVEAIEAREAAEPDLPAWEANARLRAAEANLLALYRHSDQTRTRRVAIDIQSGRTPTAVSVEADHSPTSVEVA